MTRRHGKKCRVCKQNVSKPHKPNCSNVLRNCEFKNRKRREARARQEKR